MRAWGRCAMRVLHACQLACAALVLAGCVTPQLSVPPEPPRTLELTELRCPSLPGSREPRSLEPAEPSCLPPPAPPESRSLEEPPKLRCPPLRYPMQALDEGLEGEVVITARVSPSGLLTQVQVVRTSGHAVLDAHVVRHYGRCRLDAVPSEGVPGRVQQSVRFRLQ